MKITALVEPFQPDPKYPTIVGSRRFNAVDEFTSVLGDAIGTSIAIIEGSLNDAPTDGYLILFQPPPAGDEFPAGPRVILINAARSSVPACLERDQLACAVEQHRYFLWQCKREEERGFGLFGRKEVTARIGATLTTPFQTEHYGLVTKSSYADLPSLIAGYLTVYDTLRNSGELK